MNIDVAGLHATEEFFAKSGLFSLSTNTHHPFLVFVKTESGVSVEIVSSASSLAAYPDETQVMVQWPGEWRSDWFQFTIAEYKAYAANAFNPLDHVTEAEKCVGPRGGFKYLSYRDIDQHGTRVSTSNGDRDEAAQIERYLRLRGIAILEFKE